MKIDFFICRHGQTDKNLEGVWTGCGTDVLLNETGHQQALKLAHDLKRTVMDVYTSPMLRAVQTANELVRKAAIKRELVVMQDLRECDFGDAEGLTFQQTEEQYGDLVTKLLWPSEKTADLRFPNGESKREVFERVKKCLLSIVSRHSLDYSRHAVCVVTHAGVMSALQFGLGLSNISFDNCSIVHLQYDTILRKFVPCAG